MCFMSVVTFSGVVFIGAIIGAIGNLTSNIDATKIFFRTRQDTIDDYMYYKRLTPELQGGPKRSGAYRIHRDTTGSFKRKGAW
jgi:hypothetical protein